MADKGVFIVTGGAGFIGSNCCAELARRRPGARVVCVDDFRGGSFANLVEAWDRKGLGPCSCEVLADDWTAVLGMLDPAPACVVHMAAITDTTVTDEAVMLAANAPPEWGELVALAVASGVPLVYASSAATYGTPPQAGLREPFPTDAAGHPSNIYGFSKWMMERAHVRETAKAPGAHVVGLRFFNVFGPGEGSKGEMASMAYKLAGRMLAGERPRLFADGSQARDQVHVDDVVDGVLAAAGLGEGAHPPAPGVYNLGSGRATSFADLADAVRRGLGLGPGELETEYFEMPATVRAFYQSFTCADMTATARGLGWSPRRDPIEAIGSYAAYLRERGGGSDGERG